MCQTHSALSCFLGEAKKMFCHCVIISRLHVGFLFKYLSVCVWVSVCFGLALFGTDSFFPFVLLRFQFELAFRQFRRTWRIL